MATNPRVPQGTLNRIRGSVIIPGFPTLNVTAPFLHKQGISLALQGQSTTMIPTMTGAVTSPEPYMMAQLTISLLRTQSLADLYKTRMEFDARIGDLTVTPDAATFSNYSLVNCAISNVREMTFAGEDPGFTVLIDGFYDVNSELWNLI